MATTNYFLDKPFLVGTANSRGSTPSEWYRIKTEKGAWAKLNSFFSKDMPCVLLKVSFLDNKGLPYYKILSLNNDCSVFGMHIDCPRQVQSLRTIFQKYTKRPLY